MTTQQVIAEIKKAGSEQTKKTLLKHGAAEPFYGTKVEELKKIMKMIKENRHEIALELFDSGISDAQYLAGLMAEGNKMNKKQLQDWVKKAKWSMISEYSVPWVACENKDAVSIALEWIDSPKDDVASAGWNTLSSVAITRPDSDLDISLFKKLLVRVEKEISKAPNRTRYCMNNFVIAAGSSITALTTAAKATGKKIGEVEVDMNGTACKVPFAPDYIQKVEDRGSLGKKKKTAKC